MNGNTKELPNKRPLTMDLLFVGIVSLLAVGSWVIFDVYRAVTVTTIPRVLQRQIRPLRSEIDDELIGNIRARRRFSESELLGVTPKPYIPIEQRPRTGAVTVPEPSPVLEAPTATETGVLISPTPQATQSGEINL